MSGARLQFVPCRLLHELLSHGEFVVDVGDGPRRASCLFRAFWVLILVFVLSTDAAPNRVDIQTRYVHYTLV